jgi:GNAT superfamily N-acetyltransferase
VSTASLPDPPPAARARGRLTGGPATGDSVAPASRVSPKHPAPSQEVNLSVLDGVCSDHQAAIGVWHAANLARLLPPSVERVARVWEKLAEREACLVIGRLDTETDVVAMALAEPGRAEMGAGAVIPGYGHVSMVFVHPDMWGCGVGSQLLAGLHLRASKRGWSRTTVWSRTSNARARRLYEGQGYRTSGLEATVGGGDPILQLARLAS